VNKPAEHMTLSAAEGEALIARVHRSNLAPADVGMVEHIIRMYFSHSTEFSGGACHRSSKASRRENLEIEQPVACRDLASFDFHTTLPGMLGPTLVGHQIVQMGQPAQKRLLAPFGVMEAFHRE
jgi:hypothetical protein